MTNGEPLGTIARIGRFPVKSMLGESLQTVWLGPNGVAGDRAFALRDRRDGRIVSAKRTPGVLGLRAVYPEGPTRPAAITLPDGITIPTDDPHAGAVISRALDREVELVGPDDARPDRRVEWDDENSFDAPPFGFVDLAPVHLLTSASLRAVAAHHPEGRFDARRFRPNLLVECGGRADFAEDAAIGRVLAVGDQVRLRLFMPTIRCVMTTAPQEDLSKDPGILRAAVQHHDGNLGAYATVETWGEVRVGDAVTVLPE